MTVRRRGGPGAPSSYCTTGRSYSHLRKGEVSECWKFYATPTGHFHRKTSFDVFSLSREQVWTFSVLSDRIYEMRCLFVAVGPNARFIVLPHWDNMS